MKTKQVHRRADPGDRQRGRVRTEGGRSLSRARHHRADVLPLDGQVRRDGAQRDAAAQGARGESALKQVVAEQTLDMASDCPHEHLQEAHSSLP